MLKLPFRRSHAGSCSMTDYISHQNYGGDPLIRRKMINQRFQDAKVLHSKDLYAHYGCVNAIEFSNDGEYLVSGGDDKRILLWNINKALSGNCTPKTMKGEHHSNIFCLSFDASHKKVFSAGNDEQVLLHDVETTETSDVFLHDEAVYGLSVDPVDTNLFASACDDGRILIWDIRSPATDAFTLASYRSPFHAVTYNPAEPRLLATANAKEGVNLWDIRKPRCFLMKYGQFMGYQGSMSVCFNGLGTQILALRRRMAPILYEIGSSQPSAEFDHAEYYNSCTMKSCCFAGENDQYVLSGSDDFKLYVWKVPENVCTKKSQWLNEAHLVLQGHRSIVNQVRYNGTFGILASSGVEKIIKLWSTFPINDHVKSNYLTDKDGMRKVYSHEEYINLVLESGQFMTHDYSHHSIQEDPRMMAFFDSLVQRDIEGWTSDSSEGSTTAESLNICFEVQSADSSSSMNSSTESSSEDEESQAIKSVAENQKQSDTNRPLATNGGLVNGLPRIDLRESFNRDRISRLIARKKREQYLKNSRAAKELKKKRRKHLRRKRSSVPTFRPGPTEDSRFRSAQRIISSVIKDWKVTDRRKLLQKKRSRMMRNPRISDHSSDSDGINETFNPIPRVVAVGIEPNLENNSVSAQSNVNQEGDTTRINPTTVSNGVVEYIDTLENVEEHPETPSVPHSSTNGLNESSSSTITLDSNDSLFLQPKTSKRHARNYRKRRAEDMEKDDS